MSTHKQRHQEVIEQYPHLRVKHIDCTPALRWLKHAVCNFIMAEGRLPQANSIDDEAETLLYGMNEFIKKNYDEYKRLCSFKRTQTVKQFKKTLNKKQEEEIFEPNTMLSTTQLQKYIDKAIQRQFREL
jgi:hypothetical protein